MSCMNAVDTNVLVYLHDTRDPAKQAQAAALVMSLADGVLLWQVACEYVAAVRNIVEAKTAPVAASRLRGTADSAALDFILGCPHYRGRA